MAATTVAALVLGAGLSLAARWLFREEEVAGWDTFPVVLADEPGVQGPAARPAEAARLPDADEVIGVSAGGRHRAYSIAALLPGDRHVVNDTLGGVPVTVVFWEQTNCARVFTDPTGREPLDIGVGGYIGGYDLGSMLVAVGPNHYRLDSGQPVEEGAPPFPYPRADFQRTTWKRWREAHPNTDVYVGDTRLARQGGAPAAR
jgi:hypothetical protein